MSITGKTMPVPSIESMECVDRLKVEKTTLKNMVPEPENYHSIPVKLQTSIEVLEPTLKEVIRCLGDAVTAFHDAVWYRDYCKQADNIQLWYPVWYLGMYARYRI